MAFYYSDNDNLLGGRPGTVTPRKRVPNVGLVLVVLVGWIAALVLIYRFGSVTL